MEEMKDDPKLFVSHTRAQSAPIESKVWATELRGQLPSSGLSNGHGERATLDQRVERGR